MNSEKNGVLFSASNLHEAELGARVHGLARLEHNAGEIGLVDAVRKMLCLKAHAAKLHIGLV